jgi:hypothetical protein
MISSGFTPLSISNAAQVWRNAWKVKTPTGRRAERRVPDTGAEVVIAQHLALTRRERRRTRAQTPSDALSASWVRNSRQHDRPDRRLRLHVLRVSHGPAVPGVPKPPAPPRLSSRRLFPQPGCRRRSRTPAEALVVRVTRKLALGLEVISEIPRGPGSRRPHAWIAPCSLASL